MSPVDSVSGMQRHDRICHPCQLCGCQGRSLWKIMVKFPFSPLVDKEDLLLVLCLCFWFVILRFGFVFLLILFKTHLDFNSCIFLFLILFLIFLFS